MTRSRLSAAAGVVPQWASSPPRARSAGGDYVRLAESAGLVLDPWQVLVLEESLGERADGSWASFEVGVCCPRQNGKSAVLEALMLGSLFLDGGLTIYSAHEFKTAGELFRRVSQLVQSTADLQSLVARRVTSTNEMGLELHDGSRLRFLARSGGSGRGFSGDRLIFDEAMVLSAASMGAMLPTLSARPNPQVWYAGSAGMAESDHWRAVRDRGRAGGGRLTWLEWGLEEAPADPSDRSVWAATNPGFGSRLSPEVIESEFEALGRSGETLPVWLRERLGVWDLPLNGADVLLSEFRGAWAGRADEGSEAAGTVVFAVDVAPSRGSAAIAAAGFRPDGGVHVEVIQHQPGVDWVVPRLAELVERWSPECVALDPAGPVGSLIPGLQSAGIEPRLASLRDVQQACGQLYDAVVGGSLSHLGQAPLDEAVAGAARREVGDAWLWRRRDSSADICPLVAVTVALWALSASEPTEPSVFML